MGRWWMRLRQWLIPRLDRQALGRRGERAAARFLRRQGWVILHRRYRSPEGELDLVMTDRRQIVFVEVKARLGASAAEAMDNVHPEKQRRLLQAAAAYLQRFGLQGRPIRFDVVSVVWPQEGTPPRITHIPAAFEAPEGF